MVSFFFPLQNAVCFIILTYLVPVLFTFYIENVLKCSLFHNSNVFGSYIIHILYTGCAKMQFHNSNVFGSCIIHILYTVF